ncbi:pseudouridine synthase [Agaricicola taiwanensis]|uniref:Pseudouridine synthase n=1 Tax=Agaricicola taiwanensis TaxID=591372 RepID=A0A8J2YGI3_9RHOB|nr:RluA family pseudouridine synthase [Agaricicola taiwanensis]GGE39328.1 pseudouridine synthase [Agaricicola taiwanensis]
MTDRAPRRFAVTVPPDTNERLDRVLAQALPELSRTRIQALVKAGKVFADGKVRLNPSEKVEGGTELTLEEPPPVPAVPEGEAIPLTVVYEDDDLIVIDKPAGLVVHPGAGHTGGTLVNALLAHCGGSLSGIGGVERPGIVHRLDKDTSGLLVVAKNDLAHRGLAEQFADHGRTGPLDRAYLALVWGAPLATSGTVDAPLERDPRNREKIAVTKLGRGREAITHWRVLQRFGPAEAPLASLISCRLETGRTHQIRVHLAHIGHPLLGDATYGAGFRSKAKKLSDRAREALEALDRQALHAERLAFEHPVTHEELGFDSPLPRDLQRLIDVLRISET